MNERFYVTVEDAKLHRLHLRTAAPTCGKIIVRAASAEDLDGRKGCEACELVAEEMTGPAQVGPRRRGGGVRRACFVANEC